MHTYFSAYTLAISSEIDLLIPTTQSQSSPDVTIQFGSLPDISQNRSWDGVSYEFISKDKLHLKWDILGSYEIASGTSITIDPAQPINHDNLRQPLLGTIMAMILHQRGHTTLHGSAILINNQATLFVGNKGEGKSTLASWLVSQGFPLLSDDVCTITSQTNQPPIITPAFPSIKLNPDILQHLGDDPEKHPKVHPKVPKRILALKKHFCTTPKQVSSICVLATGDKLKLEKITGVETIKEILTHMLINRFPENQPSDLQQEIFTKATKLTKAIPIYRLTRPRDLNQLPATMQLLKEL